MNTLEKVLHVPFCFHPDPVGGTEIYVESLARVLQDRGVGVIIAAPGQASLPYTHGGLHVRRFATSERANDLRVLYGDGDTVAAGNFARLLDEERPSLVHVHAFTSAVSLRLVRESKIRRIPVVFTYHTPTVSCQRGTLMRWGTEVCDGVLDTQPCTACTAHGLGLNRAASIAAGALPRGIGRLVGSSGLRGGVWTALQMGNLVELRQAAFHSLVTEVDHLVAVCDWSRELLIQNGASANKVTVSRHGLHIDAIGLDQGRETTRALGDKLRVAYFGRLDPSKGPLLLIQALRSIPEAPIQLDVYGVEQAGAGAHYTRLCKVLAGNDTRIAFFPPVPNDQVVSTLSTYAALAVPSQWLETGPLVVLEAFAARVPVIGSRLGGIAELVEHDVDGLLVDNGTPDAWARTFQELVSNPALLTRLRAGIRSPRRMTEVADDMLAIYEALLSKQPAPNAARVA